MKRLLFLGLVLGAALAAAVFALCARASAPPIGPLPKGPTEKAYKSQTFQVTVS